MFFDVVKCNTCGCPMQPDFDSSLDSYMKNEFKNESNIVIASENAPIVPDYVILKCDNRDCGATLKMTFKSFFDKLTAFWGDMAFKKSQIEARDSYTFDKYATKYLVDSVTGKVLSKKDIEGNLVLKDLFNITEKNK